jgi:hypothetical protein
MPLNSDLAIQLLENKRQTDETNRMGPSNAIASGITTAGNNYINTVQKNTEEAKKNKVALWGQELQNHDLMKYTQDDQGNMTTTPASADDYKSVLDYIGQNGDFPKGAFTLKPKVISAMAYTPPIVPPTSAIPAGMEIQGYNQKTGEPIYKKSISTNELSEDELRALAKSSILGLGTDPSFGMSANNPMRIKYQKVKAQMLNEMGIKDGAGVSSIVGQKGEVKAGLGAMTGVVANAKIQDAKVNQAIDLTKMLEQNYDTKTDSFVIPPSMHTELALGMARLLSPTGQVAVELENELRQKTAREGLAGAAIYLGFDPKEIGGTTQSVSNFFAHSIARQGQIAEQLRNQYLPKGTNAGSSFNDYLSKSKISDKLNPPETVQSGSTTPSGQTPSGAKFEYIP